jgi:Icc-related predicted phosphoesterase
MIQYKKLVNYAIRHKARYIIVGGDITPKHFSDDDTIKGERRFLEKDLPRILTPLKRHLPDSRLFLIMGNDDCAANLDILETEDPNFFQFIHGKRVELTEDYDLVGYSYVPITPFGIKDWEKYDLSDVSSNLREYYEQRKRANYNLNGFKSTASGWQRFSFTPEMEKEDSIQKDLNNNLLCMRADKTVYVFHTPPDNTYLDVGYNGNSLGSIAVRSFIENRQPYLTLHGHIHETVNRSGQYRQQIGKTLCVTAGNDDYGDELSLLVFDLYNPVKAERKLI